MNLGDKVWHPKTKLVGAVVMLAGQSEAVGNGITFTTDLPIPDEHVGVMVRDELSQSLYSIFIWVESSLELLDEEEFKAVSELVKWKKRKTELNKEVADAGSAYAAAEEAMIKFLDRMAIRGTRQYAGIGQVTIDGVELYTSITEENKEIAFKALEDMGRGEVIKRTIHPSTLKSLVSELKDTGVPVPASISVYERPKLSFAKKK